jgi:hypothetical protein
VSLVRIPGSSRPTPEKAAGDPDLVTNTAYSLEHEAAALLIVTPTPLARVASLGLAAGLLFADGDISAKLVGYGDLRLVALAPLIIAYAVGTSVL